MGHPPARCRRLALARLNKPRRLLLEFKRVPAPLPIPHLRYPFALEQLAKGYVLRGQGHYWHPYHVSCLARTTP